MIPVFDEHGPSTAPVVVLVPSLGTTRALWDPQMVALTERFRVVRVEHRGHGGATTPDEPSATIGSLGNDLVDLLDHLQVTRASICGISLGGMMALWMAAHHPDRVDRLVLACTAAELGPAEHWTARAAAVRAASPAALRSTLVPRWFTDGFRARHPQAVDTVAAMLDTVDPAGYAACCDAIAVMDQREHLGHVTAPTLVVAGADDPVTPPARALELQAGIPGASLFVVPSASHLANVEQPERFTSALVDHLCGLPFVRGDAQRRAILGNDHVDRAAAETSPIVARFSRFLTTTAWGEVWTRPTLDDRTRRLLTVALLTALGHHDELAAHTTAALRAGIGTDELLETIIHTAVYAGVPAANHAVRVLRDAIDLDT